MKKCYRCGDLKEFTEFNKRSKNKDGHDYICRECNKVVRKKYDKKYSQTDKCKDVQSKYRQSEKGKLVPIKWYENNKKRALEIQLKYRHTEKGKEKERRYYIKRYEKNKLSISISSNIRHSLKGNKQGRHWEDIVEYNLQELKEHLEVQFREGMSWDNHGEWHIDHIRPIASFDITDYECDDFKECWSLNNLQPLWAIENLKKGSKWNG